MVPVPNSDTHLGSEKASKGRFKDHLGSILGPSWGHLGASLGPNSVTTTFNKILRQGVWALLKLFGAILGHLGPS